MPPELISVTMCGVEAAASAVISDVQSGIFRFEGLYNNPALCLLQVTNECITP